MTVLKILGGGIAAIVVIAAVLLFSTGMPAGFLASSMQDRVERDTGYRLTVAGSTKIGLWPSPNVTMNDVVLEPSNDRGTGHRVTAGSLQADMTLGSLWKGQPDITELVINRPDIRIPLLRERQSATKTPPSQPSAASDNDSISPKIERITVTDGTITFFNTPDGVEDHIEGISAHAVIGADRRLSVDGNARAGGQPLNFSFKASLSGPSPQRQTLPVEISLDAPGLLRAPLSGKADVRLNGSTVMINGLSGAIGDGAFTGWASVDIADKPFVKLDLDCRRLDVAATSSPAATQGAAGGWSTDPIRLSGLNYVDADLRLSAAELNIGEAHFAPVALQGSLAHGLLKGVISNAGAYGGQINGTIDLDVSSNTPTYAIRGDINGVRALPLLKSAADFDKLDGRLQAKVDVRSNGQSQQAIMSNLAGTTVANFQDGAIRGLNVAQMIRSLTSSPLSGWQQSQEQATDLTQLSASFRIENGKANTTDLNLVGPLVKMTGGGTIDLGTKTLALRVEPKLVMTTEGQGRASDPVGFGIPVVIDGPWTSPRIYPDIAGILDNPDAAYAKLKEMGKGLFAPGEPGNDNSNDPSDTLGRLGETLGNLLQQGLSAGRNRNTAPNGPSRGAPDQPNQGSRPMNDIMRQLFGR